METLVAIPAIRPQQAARGSSNTFRKLQAQLRGLV